MDDDQGRMDHVFHTLRATEGYIYDCVDLSEARAAAPRRHGPTALPLKHFPLTRAPTAPGCLARGGAGTPRAHQATVRVSARFRARVRSLAAGVRDGRVRRRLPERDLAGRARCGGGVR